MRFIATKMMLNSLVIVRVAIQHIGIPYGKIRNGHHDVREFLHLIDLNGHLSIVFF